MYYRVGERLSSFRLMQYLPLILATMHFLTFLFVLVATPLDVFQARNDAITGECASMFGWKRCGSHAVTRSFVCGIKGTMEAAAAFAIISIFVTLTTFLLYTLTIINVFKKPLVLLALDAAACLTILISWACVAGAYNEGTCLGLPENSVYYSFRYGGAFGLMVTAWVLQMIALVGLFFVPM